VTQHGRGYNLSEEIEQWLADFEQRRNGRSDSVEKVLTEVYPRLLGRASILLEQAMALLGSGERK
jgi:hypothetical protein